MMSARTVIGIIVGAIIIGVAVSSLLLDITRDSLQVTETFGVGESTSYQIAGDVGSAHSIQVTAERFDMAMEIPGGPSLPRAEFTGEHGVKWVQQEPGRTFINLQNTGSTEMVVNGVFSVPTDPIFFAYHIVVITSGVVIIGFSLGFSLRKPRGF